MTDAPWPVHPACFNGQGKELRKLLKEHGSFETMEIHVAKKRRLTDKLNKQGGWYTESFLKKEGWSKPGTHGPVSHRFPRKMIDNAWAWARAHKRVRTNDVHKEEEIRVVLTDTFEIEDAKMEETTQSGSFEVEDRCFGSPHTALLLGRVRLSAEQRPGWHRQLRP